jgi:hypothetical protein
VRRAVELDDPGLRHDLALDEHLARGLAGKIRRTRASSYPILHFAPLATETATPFLHVIEPRWIAR